MIIYNVTLSIHPQVEQEVLAWLKEEHIPEVLETGLFLDFGFFKILESPRADSYNSFAIQYRLENWDKFDEYTENHAPALKAKTHEKFGEKVLAFRTFLEKI